MIKWPWQSKETAVDSKTPVGPYDAGVQACLAGKHLWESPHVHPHSSIREHLFWTAGWMYAKQQETNICQK